MANNTERHIDFEQIDHPAKLLDYFIRLNKSNINQCGRLNP